MLCAVISIIAGAQAQPPPKQDPTYADWLRHLTRARITVARDTTYVTGPLKPDGTVDFHGAINAIFADVKPENNAAVLLVQALGPSVAPKENAAEYFRLLKCPPPPAKGEYLIPPFRRLFDDVEIRPTLERCTREPWSPKDHPRFVDLLKKCEPGLRLVTEASKRTRFYEPWVAAKPGVDLPYDDRTMCQDLRSVVRLLSLRAMMHLHEGRLDEAVEDFETCYRLVRLVQLGPKTITEGLIGGAIMTFTLSAETAVPRSGYGASSFHRARAKRLLDLSEPPYTADGVIVFERLYALHGGVRALQFGYDQGMWGKGQESGAFQKFVSSYLIDADVALRIVNKKYDELEALEKTPDPAERARLAEVSGKKFLEQYWDFRRDPFRRIWKYVWESGVRGGMGRWAGEMHLQLMIPLVHMPFADGWRRGLTRQRQTALAYYLAAYKKDHGKFPETLDAKLLGAPADALIDPFTGQPFVYRVFAGKRQVVGAGYNKRIDSKVKPDDRNGDDFIVELPE